MHSDAEGQATEKHTPVAYRRVLRKVYQKQAAEGTPLEEEATTECSKAVQEAYRAYVQRVRDELQNLPKVKKKW